MCIRDSFPGVGHLVRRTAAQLHVTSPRVEVGRVRLYVLRAGSRPVRVEDELVGREKQAAHGALDALGARRVVPGRQEGAAAAPRALVVHGKRKVFRKSGRTVVAEKRLAQPLRLASGDHTAASRRHRHRSGASQYLQLRCV